MASPAASSSQWREAFGDEKRPTLYSSTKSQNESFEALISPSMFLKTPESLSQDQLYASAQNCQQALKMAQLEYMHLEHLIRRLEDKNLPNNPQDLPDSDQFEEEKEATLYGYKRVARGKPYTRAKTGTDFYGFQEAFSQGGFVPTEAQYKRMRAKAQDVNNIDGWTPIERDGKMLIPRMPRSPPAQQRGFTAKTTPPSRKRRLSERNNASDTDATATTTARSDSDALATPSRRGTRFLGRKIPPTRDNSEAPLSARGSPAPQRLQRLTRTSLSLAPTSQLTPVPRSANCTPTPHEAAHRPPKKRRRVNKVKYKRSKLTQVPPLSTKVKVTNGSSNIPYHHSDEDKKWTDTSLISAITADHSFLHPDPETALHWKNAIINAPNPVRSYAMKRKWAWWRKGGMDKRPRRGGGGGGGGIGRRIDRGGNDEHEDSAAPVSEDDVQKQDDDDDDDEETDEDRKEFMKTTPTKQEAGEEEDDDDDEGEEEAKREQVKPRPAENNSQDATFSTRDITNEAAQQPSKENPLPHTHTYAATTAASSTRSNHNTLKSVPKQQQQQQQQQQQPQQPQHHHPQQKDQQFTFRLDQP